MKNVPLITTQECTGVDYHALAERLVGQQLPKRRPLTVSQTLVFAEIIAILVEDRATRRKQQLETVE